MKIIQGERCWGLWSSAKEEKETAWLWPGFGWRRKWKWSYRRIENVRKREKTQIWQGSLSLVERKSRKISFDVEDCKEIPCCSGIIFLTLLKFSSASSALGGWRDIFLRLSLLKNWSIGVTFLSFNSASMCPSYSKVCSLERCCVRFVGVFLYLISFPQKPQTVASVINKPVFLSLRKPPNCHALLLFFWKYYWKYWNIENIFSGYLHTCRASNFKAGFSIN